MGHMTDAAITGEVGDDGFIDLGVLPVAHAEPAVATRDGDVDGGLDFTNFADIVDPAMHLHWMYMLYFWLLAFVVRWGVTIIMCMRSSHPRVACTTGLTLCVLMTCCKTCMPSIHT